MIALGIDPGLNEMGLAFVRSDSSGYKYLQSAHVKLSKKLQRWSEEWWRVLEDTIEDFYNDKTKPLRFYYPDVVAIEDFTYRPKCNAKAIQVLRVIGRLEGFFLGTKTMVIEANDWRTSLCHSKSPSNETVRRAVVTMTRVIGLSQHEIDAIGIAIIGIGRSE